MAFRLRIKKKCLSLVLLRKFYITQNYSQMQYERNFLRELFTLNSQMAFPELKLMIGLSFTLLCVHNKFWINLCIDRCNFYLFIFIYKKRKNFNTKILVLEDKKMCIYVRGRFSMDASHQFNILFVISMYEWTSEFIDDSSCEKKDIHVT